MFTGIIQAVGEVAALEPQGGDLRLRVRAEGLDLGRIAPGDSIAVNGVCLTATALPGDGFWADVSGETLACTTFAALRVGAAVNLEPALTPSTPLGGHLVSGHVDGVGELLARRPEGRSIRFQVRVPRDLARYIAAKGSICLEGVSLTVNSIKGTDFDLNIVPHTLEKTTLGALVPGSRMNLEVDLIARYLERLLLGAHGQGEPPSGLTRELLARHGFVKGEG